MKSRNMLTLVLVSSVLFFICGTSEAAEVPDLTVDIFKTVPAPVVSNGTATIIIVVKNVGTGNSKAVPLFISGDTTILKAFGIPMYNSMEHGVLIPSLAAGQYKEFSFGKVGNISAGSYTIQAKIWPVKPGAAAPKPGEESNLSNNQRDLTVSVIAAPPLTIPKKPVHKIPQDVQSVPRQGSGPLN